MLLLGQEPAGHWQSQPDLCVHVVASVESPSKQPYPPPPQLTTNSRAARGIFYYIKDLRREAFSGVYVNVCVGEGALSLISEALTHVQATAVVTTLS